MDEDDVITPVYRSRPNPSPHRLDSFEPAPLLSLAPVLDCENRPILLLRSEALSADLATGPLPQYCQALIRGVEKTPHVLVYLHAGLASTTPASIFSVRAFRAAYEKLASLQARQNLVKIVLVHVSFATRAHIYASSFAMACKSYARIHYCDLLVDLEHTVGVEPLLLGLRDVDLEYDETMRYWVDRQHEPRPGGASEKVPRLDPAKPLIDVNNISFDREGDSTHPSNSLDVNTRPAAVEEP